MKLAVVFPGVGYHTDKPLLYYSKKLLKEGGYEILEVKYENLPSKIKGDKKKMEEAFNIARQQSKEALKDVCFGDYESIVFVAKSIGTAIASAIASEFEINPYMVLLTPVAETFDFVKDFNCVAFHGTSDDWADTDKIKELCAQKNIKLHLFKDANHSLETGNTATDLAYLHETVRIVSEYVVGI